MKARVQFGMWQETYNHLKEIVGWMNEDAEDKASLVETLDELVWAAWDEMLREREENE